METDKGQIQLPDGRVELLGVAGIVGGPLILIAVGVAGLARRGR